MFPDNKKKALTFSFDDGVSQDIRLIELFDKYGLKGTFNLNSGLLGNRGELERFGKKVDFNRISPEDVNKIYRNHEVAVHTLTHPNLCKLEEREIIRQVEEDRLALSDLCGYEVVSMAYPSGGVNNDARVAEVIKNNTGVRFSRTITSSGSYDLQDNLYQFNPTVYHIDIDEMFRLGNEFLKMKTEMPKIFYIWGHSFEFDALGTWERFEKFCRMMSGKDDIFYGTNKEILLR